MLRIHNIFEQIKYMHFRIQFNLFTDCILFILYICALLYYTEFYIDPSQFTPNIILYLLINLIYFQDDYIYVIITVAVYVHLNIIMYLLCKYCLSIIIYRATYLHNYGRELKTRQMNKIRLIRGLRGNYVHGAPVGAAYILVR